MKTNLNWKMKSFQDLQPLELYRLLQLRSSVFVLEQTCLYQDMDDRDQAALHLWLEDEKGQILAACRLLKAGVTFPDAASIGRVLTAPGVRGQGFGQLLMEKALSVLTERQVGLVKIEAQLYAKAFYEKVGFRQISDVFLEDGIEHIAMAINL